MTTLVFSNQIIWSSAVNVSPDTIEVIGIGMHSNNYLVKTVLHFSRKCITCHVEQKMTQSANNCYAPHEMIDFEFVPRDSSRIQQQFLCLLNKVRYRSKLLDSRRARDCIISSRRCPIILYKHTERC